MKEIKPIEFRIGGEQMSFSPLPLSVLDIIRRMQADLKLEEPKKCPFPIMEFLRVIKTQKDTFCKMVALYTLGGQVNPSSVKLRSDFLMAHCSDEDLLLLFYAGVKANEMWIHEARTNTAEINFSNITSDDFLCKPFCQIFNNKISCHR